MYFRAANRTLVPPDTGNEMTVSAMENLSWICEQRWVKPYRLTAYVLAILQEIIHVYTASLS
jgi:hypothetical protein